MPNLAVVSLSAGKVTPLIDVRSDTEKYSSTCRILDNMIPRIYGPVTRRPGTLYFANVDDDDVKSRMIAFKFSATIAYKLEFSNKILNVYFEQTLVDSDIVTPYLEADLYQLQVRQIADVMWIVHPSYAPRKLSRVSTTEFSLDTITFSKGPFIERNDIAKDDGVTITVTGTTIATATAGGAGLGSFTITNTTDTSSLFPVNGRFYVTGSTGNDAAYTVKTASFSSPTLTVTPNESVADGTDDGEIMVDGGTVTLTVSSAVFTTGSSGHTGSLFKITHKRLKTVSKGTATGTGIIGEPINIKGSWTAKTGGNWDAVLEIQRLEDGTNWEVVKTFVSTITNSIGSGNLLKTEIEEADNIQFRLFITEFTSGTVEADITANTSTQDSIFRITATASTTSATATAVIAAPDNVAAKRWAEGAWSAVRGYPSAITFFEERAVYGFTTLDTRSIWPSEIGKFEDFEAGIKDADSFGLVLPTTDTGRWLASLDVLAAGTTGGEWILQTPIDEPLTPTNFRMLEQTRHGSSDIQAIEVNEAILFINSVARKVREFTFSDARQKHVSPDLTALAEDIMAGGITSVAVQKNPDSIVWFTIANSPYLVSMTYEREQNVVAFANHPLGGDGIAESVIVTPGTSEDIVTLSAKRTINSSTVRFIEDMQPRDFGSITDPTNAFFVDAGIIDTDGSTTIPNLGHLEREEVAVLVDGAVQASKTVSGSQITIDEAGDRVVVGLPYTYQVSPMRLDITTPKGTTHGTIKKIPELVISFFATGNAQYGDGVDTFTIDWRTTEPHDSPPNLFTGDKIVIFDAGFSTEDNIVISGSDPLPCTVRAIIARTDITGR